MGQDKATKRKLRRQTRLWSIEDMPKPNATTAISSASSTEDTPIPIKVTHNKTPKKNTPRKTQQSSNKIYVPLFTPPNKNPVIGVFNLILYSGIADCLKENMPLLQPEVLIIFAINYFRAFIEEEYSQYPSEKLKRNITFETFNQSFEHGNCKYHSPKIRIGISGAFSKFATFEPAEIIEKLSHSLRIYEATKTPIIVKDPKNKPRVKSVAFNDKNEIARVLPHLYPFNPVQQNVRRTSSLLQNTVQPLYESTTEIEYEIFINEYIQTVLTTIDIYLTEKNPEGASLSGILKDKVEKAQALKETIEVHIALAQEMSTNVNKISALHSLLEVIKPENLANNHRLITYNNNFFIFQWILSLCGYGRATLFNQLNTLYETNHEKLMERFSPSKTLLTKAPCATDIQAQQDIQTKIDNLDIAINQFESKSNQLGQGIERLQSGNNLAKENISIPTLSLLKANLYSLAENLSPENITHVTQAIEICVDKYIRTITTCREIKEALLTELKEKDDELESLNLRFSGDLLQISITDSPFIKSMKQKYLDKLTALKEKIVKFQENLEIINEQLQTHEKEPAIFAAFKNAVLQHQKQIAVHESVGKIINEICETIEYFARKIDHHQGGIDEIHEPTYALGINLETTLAQSETDIETCLQEINEKELNLQMQFDELEKKFDEGRKNADALHNHLTDTLAERVLITDWNKTPEGKQYNKLKEHSSRSLAESKSLKNKKMAALKEQKKILSNFLIKIKFHRAACQFENEFSSYKNQLDSILSTPLFIRLMSASPELDQPWQTWKEKEPLDMTQSKYLLAAIQQFLADRPLDELHGYYETIHSLEQALQKTRAALTELYETSRNVLSKKECETYQAILQTNIQFNKIIETFKTKISEWHARKVFINLSIQSATIPEKAEKLTNQFKSIIGKFETKKVQEQIVLDSDFSSQLSNLLQKENDQRKFLNEHAHRLDALKTSHNDITFNGAWIFIEDLVEPIFPATANLPYARCEKWLEKQKKTLMTILRHINDLTSTLKEYVEDFITWQQTYRNTDFYEELETLCSKKILELQSLLTSLNLLTEAVEDEIKSFTLFINTLSEANPQNLYTNWEELRAKIFAKYQHRLTEDCITQYVTGLKKGLCKLNYYQIDDNAMTPRKKIHHLFTTLSRCYAKKSQPLQKTDQPGLTDSPFAKPSRPFFARTSSRLSISASPSRLTPTRSNTSIKHLEEQDETPEAKSKRISDNFLRIVELFTLTVPNDILTDSTRYKEWLILFKSHHIDQISSMKEYIDIHLEDAKEDNSAIENITLLLEELIHFQLNIIEDLLVTSDNCPLAVARMLLLKPLLCETHYARYEAVCEKLRNQLQIHRTLKEPALGIAEKFVKTIQNLEGLIEGDLAISKSAATSNRRASFRY